MQASATSVAPQARDPRVVIVGAGMSGLLMGIRLQRAGIHDFTILEKAASLGGTWRENTYPGIACDIPSHFYSYSFAPNPGWSHWFAPGDEINDYLERVADEHGVRQKVQYRKEVAEARRQGDGWHILCTDGTELDADIIVAATGVLHHPNVPKIPGLKDFAGACFHSAQWDHTVPLDGRRVGVIGTGSTAAQITAALVPRVSRFSLFQRTAQWIFPLPNPPHSRFAKWCFRNVPGAGKLWYHLTRLAFQWSFSRAVLGHNLQHRVLSWIARRNLEKNVRDPQLRERLRPDYEPFCKRLIISPDFYDKIQQPNAELVTSAIDRIEADGVRTKDGTLHALDVLVLATGFEAQRYVRPLQLINEQGATLEQAWADGARALRSVAMPGFPNFFMVAGPYTPVGNYPLISTSEIQVDYIMAFVERFRRGEAQRFEARPEALERFVQDMDEGSQQTIWRTGGCHSWYLDARGRVTMWPWSFERFRREMRQPRWDEYQLS